MENYVERLTQEIKSRGLGYSGKSLETLYLGGGTPSLLSPENLDKILEAVHHTFSFTGNAEITAECNPDDLDPLFLQYLDTRGFNRLSIGLQSFQEKDLVLMRRSHKASQAEKCVKDAAYTGFENISIDLIYGIPGQTIQEWEENIERASLLPISHLSAYHLTFEPGTVFDHWRKNGRLEPMQEEKSIRCYHLLREKLLLADYDHYEISNFALGGKMSEHNLLYWSGLPYLGVGPSAHSFDGKNRSWNVSSLKKYMEGNDYGNGVSETENLSLEEQYHDYLITSLRTRWGADPEHLEQHFGEKFRKHFEQKSETFLEEGSMWITEGNTAIHSDHWLITDHILRELFMD